VQFQPLKYLAFISYRHEALSRLHAESLEAAIKSYAKPIWQPPAPVFRDERVLRPGDDLPASIRRALEDSNFLIYLATPNAATSWWVCDELRIWCDELKRADRLLIVQIAGRIGLDDRNREIEWDETDALPTILRPHIQSIPIWTDLIWAGSPAQRDLSNVEYKRSVNALVARLRGKSPADMNDQQVLVHRRNLMLRNAGMAAIGISAVIATTFGLEARQSAAAARVSQDLAEAETRKTLEQIKVADAARKDADNQRVKADHERNIAEEERKKATASRDEAVEAKGKEAEQRRQAEQQRDLALSRQLAAEGRAISSEQPDLGLLLALHSLQVTDTAQGRSALWDLLSNLPHLGVYLRRGTSKVFGLANNPDASILASAEGDGMVRLMDAHSGKLLAELKDHQAAVSSVAFSPAGDRLVSASYDETLVVWDVETKQAVRRLPGPSGAAVTRAAFVGDAEHLVAVTGEGSVLMYTLLPDKRFRMRRMASLDAPLRSLDVSKDGMVIAAGSDDGLLMVWTRTDDEWMARSAMAHVGGTMSVALSADGSRLFSGGHRGEIKRWETAALREEGPALSGHSDAVYALALTADGRTLISGSGDKTVRAWEAESGKPLFGALAGHGKAVFALAAGSVKDGFVSGGGDHALIRWNLESSPHLWRSAKVTDAKLFAVGFSADGRALVVGGDQGVLRLMDADSLRPGTTMGPVNGPVGSFIFLQSGKAISAGAQGLLSWGSLAETGSLVSTAEEGVMYTAFAAQDGRHAVTGGPDGTVALWNLTSASRRWLKRRQAGESRAVAIDATKGVVAVAGDAGTIDILNLQDGSPSGPSLKGHKLTVISLDVDPLRNRLASGALDGTVRLWDLKRRVPLAELSGRMGPVLGVAFDKAGRTVAAAGRNGTVVLWDIESSTQYAVLADALHGPVTAIRYSPDGLWLAGVDEQGNVAKWMSSVGAWHDIACRVVNGRVLSEPEQLRYLGRIGSPKVCAGAAR